jgi:hypothetical protein
LIRKVGRVSLTQLLFYCAVQVAAPSDIAPTSELLQLQPVVPVEEQGKPNEQNKKRERKHLKKMVLL